MAASAGIVDLPLSAPLWERVFTVAPLVLVGTREPDGSVDLAPKHMAMPLGWQNRWCFVCSPSHATYRNARRSGEFTASFVGPDQMLAASLAAGPRDGEGRKPTLAALPTFPARHVDGVLVEGCRLWLECALERVVDGFGPNALIVGELLGAAAPEDCVRDAEVDDGDLLRASPLTAYVSPGRFAAVGDTRSFPFHVDTRR